MESDERLMTRDSVAMLSDSVMLPRVEDAMEVEDALASTLKGGRGGCISTSCPALLLAVSLPRLLTLLKLLVLALPFTFRPSELTREERLTVDRRRASLTDTGKTIPSPLRPKREKRGVAAVESQFCSGSREVLGMLRFSSCVGGIGGIVAAGAVERLFQEFDGDGGAASWARLSVDADACLLDARAQDGRPGTGGASALVGDDGLESVRARTGDSGEVREVGLVGA